MQIFNYQAVGTIKIHATFQTTQIYLQVQLLTSAYADRFKSDTSNQETQTDERVK